MKAVLYFNGEKVKEGKYPREDMQPILDLESGYEWQILTEDELPTYDSKKQTLKRVETKTELVNSEYKHLKNTVISYEVEDLPIEDLKVFLIEENESKKQSLIRKKTEDKIIEEAQLKTDKDSLDEQALFPMWEFPFDYKKDVKCQDFNAENQLVLYKCVQGHTSQGDWQPKDVPALFTRVAYPDEILNFVQPTGAQDAYQIGDRVLFEGKVYESTINANVWSPKAYAQGWTEIK